MKTVCTVESGMKFNRLTAIREAGRDKNGHSLWLFKCDCGKEKIIERYQVVKGGTKSCGCWNDEVRKSGDNRRDHGKCNSRLYRIWQAMKSRCNAPVGSENWKWYTKKGIKVCDEWQTFKPFQEWALNNGYDDTLTIDRIDVNGNYEPCNCRWASLKQQANNRNDNPHIQYQGETHTISEWSDITGIRYQILAQRYWKGDRDDRLFRKPRKPPTKRKAISQ